MVGQRTKGMCWCTLVAFFVAVVLLGGCGPSRSTSRQRSEAQFSLRDETLTWRLPVHERAERLVFAFDVSLTSGTAHWTLLDPTGVERAAGTGQAGRREHREHRFEVVEGEWVLTLELTEAGGRYAWDWSSSWVDR